MSMTMPCELSLAVKYFYLLHGGAAATKALQNTDEEVAELDEEEAERITAVEEELLAAAARLEEAQNKLFKGQPTLKGSTNTKNTSARTDKEVRRSRWEAKHALEGRVHDAAKKGKERLRLQARDKRADFQVELEEQAVAEPSKPAVSRKPATPLWESDEVKAGAKRLASRVTSLQDRPDSTEKKAALLSILMAGRESYYTLEPADVLLDMKDRGLVEATLATDLEHLLQSGGAPAKGAPVPQEEWLSHAQKMKGVKVLEKGETFKGEEETYLKWLDGKTHLEAEAELAVAEAELEEMLHHVNICYPLGGLEEDGEPQERPPAGSTEVDIDLAEKLENQHGVQKQSHGTKNTSARSEKVVSSEKWLAARAAQGRQLEKGKRARGARREEARDRKTRAGDVPNEE